MDIEAGPNWDDDLGGSPIYADNDPNLDGALTEEQRQQFFAIERLVFFYLPRICNHCLNPACVAACPSGALYKRGEDGIVLVDQNRCRAWRACVPACPYKKTFYNWTTGKSEKCILCFPRLETGQAPACFHSCVGPHPLSRRAALRRRRASRRSAKRRTRSWSKAQRSLILDPHDPEVIAAARSERHPRVGDRGGAAIAGLPVRQGLEARAAAAHRVPHAADAVLRAAAVAGDGEPHGRRRRTRFGRICSTTSSSRACR